MKKTQPLIFFGASPFAEVSEIVNDINAVCPRYEIAGILDDDAKMHGKKVCGVPVLGPLEMWHSYPNAKFVMCIGSYKSRVDKFNILCRLGIEPERYETLIHPDAKIYPDVVIGLGTIIHKGAVIFNDALLEKFVTILPNCVVGIRNRLCEGAMLTPLVSTTKDAVIGHYAHIGSLSCIGEKVKIGPCAQVGMGSVILKDVPPGVFCMGSLLKTVFLDKVEVPDTIMKAWKDKYGV